MEIYPVWDLTLPAIPARSQLYPLEPVGLGTGEVESLSSYAARLADAHCLPIATLFNGVVSPLILQARGLTTAPDSQALVFVNAARPINGMGVTASACVQALEALTLRRDLRWLTALAWQEIFSTQGWLRPVRAWCPACFESQHREARIVYEQLRWTLRVVTSCPIHQRMIVTICPYCRCESLALTYRSRPGYCARCSRWLGSMDAAEPLSNEISFSDWDWRLWTAQAVGELLAAPPTMTIQPQRVRLVAALTGCMDHFTEGRPAGFAYHFGLADSSLRKCLKGQCLPKLETLLRISYLTGLGPLDFINGTAVFPDSATRQSAFVCPPDKPPLGKPRLYRQEQRTLRAALDETPPPALAEVAVRLRYSQVSSLYRVHSELCRQITARHRTFLQEQRQSRVGKRITDDLAARQIVDAALQEHPPPSAREVARRLGYTWIAPLQQGFPELYQQILDRRREHWRQTDEAVRTCFQSALSEKPPPTVWELAGRLGFISAGTLKRNYPDLCQALTARHPEYCQRRLAQVEAVLRQACQEQPAPSLRGLAQRCGYQSYSSLPRLFPELCRQITARHAAERKESAVWLEAQLRAALDEAIPPSVKGLSGRLNFEKGTLYRYFPELCAELSARRSRHFKEEAIKRERQRKAEICQVVNDLHSKGIYPSYEKVLQQISAPSPLWSPSDRETLRAAKLELGIQTTRR